MIHAWAKLASATAAASGSMTSSSTPAATNGTTCATVVSVHNLPRVRSRAASIGARQWTAAVSGSGAPAAWTPIAPLSAADRQPQDHQVGVDGQLLDLLGVARARRDHRKVPAVELLAERVHGGLDRRRVVPGPLRERGVAGPVHAHET